MILGLQQLSQFIKILYFIIMASQLSIPNSCWNILHDQTEPTSGIHDEDTLGRADCKDDGRIYRNDESWIPSKNSTCRTCSCKVCIFSLLHECTFFLLVFFNNIFLGCILQTSFMIFYDFCSTDNGLYDFEVFDYRHRSMQIIHWNKI